MKKNVFIISKTEQIIKLSQPVDDGHSTKLFKKPDDKAHVPALEPSVMGTPAVISKDQ